MRCNNHSDARNHNTHIETPATKKQPIAKGHVAKPLVQPHVAHPVPHHLVPMPPTPPPAVAYQPIPPAVGTVVDVLPPDNVCVDFGGVKVFLSGGVRYRPFWLAGRLLYRVIG